MLIRNESGKLFLQSLDLEIFLADLFVKCKNEREVEWLKEQLQESVEVIAEEAEEEFKKQGS